MISRLLRTSASAWPALLLLAAVALGGCFDRTPAIGPAKQLTVASRTAVAIMTRTGREVPTPLGGTYIGDVIAVTGYDLAPVAPDNRVLIGGVACPVLGSVVLDPAHELGPFTALYVEVRSDVPVGAAQVVQVWRPAPATQPDNAPITLGAKPEWIAPNTATTVAVHRLAYATPVAGNVVHAIDLTAQPPAWISPRDLAVSSLPSAVVMSPDGRFALFANGADLQVTAIADGQRILQASGFFGGAVGTMAISRDGTALAATVFPAGAAPQVVLADLSWLKQFNFNVIATTGLLLPGVTAPPSPARIAVGLGGPAAGGLAFTADASRLYITLSSGVVRVLNLAPQSIPTFAHELPTPTGAAPFGITLTPDDRLALVTDVAFGLLVPIDTADGAMQSPLLAGTAPIRPQLTSDGAHLLVTDAAGGALRVFRTTTNTVHAAQPTLALGFAPSDAARAPEGLGGRAGRNTLVLIDGNRLRFAEVDLAGGALSIGSTTTGPFPNGLRLLAVTPSR